jgi:hypothetical protein
MAMLVTAIFCMTAASSGCVPAPTGAEKFAISYERSGGLGAMPQKLVIRSGRRATQTTRNAGAAKPRTVHFRVGVGRVQSLRRALAHAEFATIESPVPGPAVCADCFSYAIRYRGHEVEFDESQIPERLHGALRQLEAVIAAH